MGGPAAGGLERLAERTGADFPHLLAARERTERELAGIRERVAGAELDPDAALVLFGSWGRAEVTQASDEDWALLYDGAPREAARAQTEAVAGRLGGEGRAPGATGLFGGAIFAEELRTRIGLDRDDNTNLTRRMLLLLESRAALGAAPHAHSRASVLDGYLADADKPYRPPRFLLNDLMRYWRTICVDFVGKQRSAEDDEKWALRHAKLRTGRKVLFAGGLVPVLLCHRHTLGGMRDFLAEQLAQPPTDRLAAAFLAEEVADAGVRALGAYDRWIGLLDDPEQRAALARLSREEAERSPLFADVRRLADELEQGLLTLLFDTRLQPLVREYGIF